jgi:hypothetical protein
MPMTCILGPTYDGAALTWLDERGRRPRLSILSSSSLPTLHFIAFPPAQSRGELPRVSDGSSPNMLR